MAPRGNRPATLLRRVSVLAIGSALLAAACSGAAATPAPTPTAVPPTVAPTLAPSPTPAPTIGPAVAALTLNGPAGAAGALSHEGIRCNQPSLAGLSIVVLAQPTDPNLSVYITLQPGQVSVRFDSGSGATYVERDFTGTGVTNFDPGKGATIDTQLTETPTTGAHGTLGILTSLSGSVECGNQMPGSSTLILTGPSARGTFNGGMDAANVECTNGQYGPAVSIIGTIKVGSTPEELVIYIAPGTFSVSASGSGFYNGFFRSTATAKATLTATGATVDGDALETNLAKGATAHTIHVTGDATCGTSVSG